MIQSYPTVEVFDNIIDNGECVRIVFIVTDSCACSASNEHWTLAGDTVIALTRAVRSLEARAPFGTRAFTVTTSSDDVSVRDLLHDVRVLSRVQEPNTITWRHASDTTTNADAAVLRRSVGAHVVELRCSITRGAEDKHARMRGILFIYDVIIASGTLLDGLRQRHARLSSKLVSMQQRASAPGYTANASTELQTKHGYVST
jgi:hypothetical protein